MVSGVNLVHRLHLIEFDICYIKAIKAKYKETRQFTSIRTTFDPDVS